MAGERFFLGSDARSLSRAPSAEMVLIAQQIPDIICRSREGICSSSPKNFIGSLVLEMLRDRNVLELTNDGLIVPAGISNPIEVIRNVPVSLEGDQSKPLDAVAGEVLYKRGCGFRLGVVLNGPLTGLFLRPNNTRSPQSGMHVNRIWNDEVASADDSPYKPEPFEELEKISITDNSRFSTNSDHKTDVQHLLRGQVSRFFSEYEREVVETENVLGRDVYESEVFFRLCRKLSISVDEAAFHYTRSSDECFEFDNLLFQ